jgi:hypothetical protein
MHDEYLMIWRVADDLERAGPGPQITRIYWKNQDKSQPVTQMRWEHCTWQTALRIQSSGVRKRREIENGQLIYARGRLFESIC